MAAAGSDAMQQWVFEQVEAYIAVRPRFQSYADTINKILAAAAKSYGVLAIIQTRPKAVGSFAEKVQRKRGKYRDPVHQLTDLCGARVITDTSQEVEIICRFIEDHFEVDWENTCDVSQRLKPTEFGYRSIHYIVQLKPDVFPCQEVMVTPPADAFGLKAEIQVRTVLEHAWASFAHDRTYKAGIQLPVKIQRELAGLAAVLEDVSQDFTKIEKDLQLYAAGSGAYMDEQQIQNEVEILNLVLKYDAKDVKVAERLGNLVITKGDWESAVNVLSPYQTVESAVVLRNLGFALCMLNKTSADHEKEFQQGIQYLRTASDAPFHDPAAMEMLGNLLWEADRTTACDLLQKAFLKEPSNAQILVSYLCAIVCCEDDLSSVQQIKPLIQIAIAQEQTRADAGVNLPWAFYHLAVLALLTQDVETCLSALTRAVAVSHWCWMIDNTLDILRRLECSRDLAGGYALAKRFLLAARTARFPTECRSELQQFASRSALPENAPIIVISGGWDELTGDDLNRYQRLLLYAFHDFRGVILGSGRLKGTGQLLGDLQDSYPHNLCTIGYISEGAAAEDVDQRRSELRKTNSHAAPLIEELQVWIDLLASNISLSQVRVLAIGSAGSASFSVPLALGARVGMVQDGSRAAVSLLNDPAWRNSANLIPLPEDDDTVRAFIGSGTPKLPQEVRVELARSIHSAYRADHMDRLKSTDRALAVWEELPEGLKESNQQQADHIQAKLSEVHCAIQPVHERPIIILEFTQLEVETLAKMEHGRWTIERLQDGWKLGALRDPERKISPSLVPWKELPEDVKEWNRQAIRKIPHNLAEIGLEIVRTRGDV